MCERRCGRVQGCDISPWTELDSSNPKMRNSLRIIAKNVNGGNIRGSISVRSFCSFVSKFHGRPVGATRGLAPAVHHYKPTQNLLSTLKREYSTPPEEEATRSVHELIGKSKNS
jgi:hypothetical protein